MWAGIPEPKRDERLMDLGVVLPTRYYADQPYLTKTKDGGILCVVTTGTGHEGSRGQHVVSMKSFDGGFNWQDFQPVEDPEGPESSWGIPFTAPNGRIFVFYVHNTEDLRELPADDPPYPGGITHRMDSHGHYVFRWSDDHGKTWSQERVEIPVREFAIDRENTNGGKIRLFWNVGKAFLHQEALYLPLHKVGGLGEGWFTRSEGALLRSPDLLTTENPQDAQWETLPEGDVGIRAPSGGGSIAEEHSFVTLSDDTIFTVFRTIDGYPACAYSRDGGRWWEPSQYMCYAEGRRIKNPRAANFVWKLPDGGYLYCFHNHGGRTLRESPKRRTVSYTGRNPVWFCRGWEVDGINGKELRWSEPEIGLYHDDPMVRMSYPDFMALENNEWLFTETQKAEARIHRLDPSLVAAMSADVTKRGDALATLECLGEWRRELGRNSMPFPKLPALAVRSAKPPYGLSRMRTGFSIDFCLEMGTGGPAVLARYEAGGAGFWIEWTEERTVRLRMNDGETEVSWACSPLDASEMKHRITVNVDGGSGTICFFRNGIFDDGGDLRDYGWGRMNPFFRGPIPDWADIDLSDHSLPANAQNSLNGQLDLPGDEGVKIDQITFFGRVLTASEIGILIDLNEEGIMSNLKFSLGKSLV